MLKLQRIMFVSILLLSFSFFLWNCDKKANEPENEAPTITNLTANPQHLDWGGISQLIVIASDPEGTPLNYLWTCSEGQFTTLTDNDTVTWKAPLYSDDCEIKVQVDDGEKFSSSSKILTVTAHPVLAIDEDTLAFGTETTSLSFNIINTGTGTLTWEIETSSLPSWISVSPDAGETTSQSQVTATVDRTNIAWGSYTTQIKIIPTNESLKKALAAGFSEMNVVATMEIPRPPTLEVTPTSQDFGTTTTSSTFNINNIGTGTVTWAIQSDNVPAWLSLTPTSGTTESETDTITVTVNRANLTPGNYTAQIPVSSNGGDVTVSIQMVVQAVLNATPSSLDFGTSTTMLNFNITNTGSGILTWSILENTAWLTVTPTNGTTTTETDQITASVNRTGLASGTYTALISITSDGGNATVDVQMEVIAPVLNVSPTSLDFGTTTTTLNFNITNTGGGNLTWAITENTAWLTVTPTNGTTTTETDQITASVNRTGLAAGTYSAQISVTSDGGDVTVDVQMEVIDQPVLNVTPTSLNFGTTTTTLTFNISNAGTGTLNWTVVEHTAWLDVNPIGGTVTTETDQITVTVNRAGLDPGTYTAKITVNPDAGSVTVDVQMEVPAPSGEWLSYDDENYEGKYNAQPTDWFFVVRFDRPTGWNNFTIKKIKIKFSTTGTDDIVLACFNTTYTQGAYFPNQVVFNTGDSNPLNPVTGWNEWNVNWQTSLTRFCVGYLQVYSYAPDPYYDSSNPDVRSYRIYGTSANNLTAVRITDIDWAIQIYVEPVAGTTSLAEESSGMWLSGERTFNILPGKNISVNEQPGNLNVEELNKLEKMKKMIINK